MIKQARPPPLVCSQVFVLTCMFTGL